MSDTTTTTTTRCCLHCGAVWLAGPDAPERLRCVDCDTAGEHDAPLPQDCSRCRQESLRLARGEWEEARLQGLVGCGDEGEGDGHESLP